MLNEILLKKLLQDVVDTFVNSPWAYVIDHTYHLGC